MWGEYNMRPVLICLACGTLAACGGGGDAVKLPGPGAFNEMIIDFNNLNRRALDERIPSRSSRPAGPPGRA